MGTCREKFRKTAKLKKPRINFTQLGTEKNIKFEILKKFLVENSREISFKNFKV